MARRVVDAVVKEIIAGIRKGETPFAAGETMPSAEVLAGMLGASQRSIETARGELVAQGFIKPLGKKYVVRARTDVSDGLFFRLPDVAWPAAAWDLCAVWSAVGYAVGRLRTAGHDLPGDAALDLSLERIDRGTARADAVEAAFKRDVDTLGCAVLSALCRRLLNCVKVRSNGSWSKYWCDDKQWSVAQEGCRDFLDRPEAALLRLRFGGLMHLMLAEEPYLEWGKVKPTPGPDRALSKVAESLSGQVIRGRVPFVPGALLPASRHLATEFGVSKTTVQAAYRELLETGLLFVGPGGLRVGPQVLSIQESEIEDLLGPAKPLVLMTVANALLRLLLIRVFEAQSVVHARRVRKLSAAALVGMKNQVVYQTLVESSREDVEGTAYARELYRCLERLVGMVAWCSEAPLAVEFLMHLIGFVGRAWPNAIEASFGDSVNARFLFGDCQEWVDRLAMSTAPPGLDRGPLTELTLLEDVGWHVFANLSGLGMKSHGYCGHLFDWAKRAGEVAQAAKAR